MSEARGGTSDGEETPSTLDRRKLLKRGAFAAGVAGAAWAAPRVEGLSLRPDYAAAATNNPNQPGTFVFNLALPPISGVLSGTTNQNLPVFGGPANVTWGWNFNGPVSANGNLPANCSFNGWTVTGRQSQDDPPGLAAKAAEGVNVTGPPAGSAATNYNSSDLYAGTATLTIVCT